jgi:hypothetical protein
LEKFGREKKIFAACRQMKIAISLKEASHSTWEELCFLEVDSVEKVGKVSLVMILVNSRKCRFVGGMCEPGMKSLKYEKIETQKLCN